MPSYMERESRLLIIRSDTTMVETSTMMNIVNKSSHKNMAVMSPSNIKNSIKNRLLT